MSLQACSRRIKSSRYYLESLYGRCQCTDYLEKAFMVDANAPPSLAYGYSVQMKFLEKLINSLVAQVSGMEKFRFPLCM
jgi:hypothetical protein